MTAIELFPCAGGMAEGFRRAGITFTWAFDIAKEHCDSYEKNLGHRPVQMDVRDLLRMVRDGWRPTKSKQHDGLAQQIDLLVADPPCTPWSRAGKRKGVEDPRDMLGETCELILLLRPRAYLIGNVPGLDDATQWHHVQLALAPLRKAGYCIADYASLDAADFGVPQHRIRPFWFGHLEGPCISWPLPTHGAPSANGQLPGTEMKPWVTCRDALHHLPLEQLGRPVRLKQRPQDHTFSQPDGVARTVTKNTHSDGAVIVNKRHAPAQPAQPAQPAPTLGAKVRGQSGEVLDLRGLGHPVSLVDEPSLVVKTNGGRASGHGSMISFGEVTVRPHHHTDASRPARTQMASRSDDARVLSWPWDRPSTTVTGGDRIPPPGHHPESGSILSQPNAVVLSELAATILQGFPESWVFCGATKTARWSQLGQAVPPLLAHAVATGVVEQMSRARKVA